MLRVYALNYTEVFSDRIQFVDFCEECDECSDLVTKSFVEMNDYRQLKNYHVSRTMELKDRDVHALSHCCVHSYSEVCSLRTPANTVYMHVQKYLYLRSGVVRLEMV